MDNLLQPNRPNLSILLKCSVCLEMLTGRIIQCKNGHNICSEHNIQRLRICPDCRIPYSSGSSRNLFAENMVKLERERQETEARVLFANNTNSAAAPSQPLNFTVNPAVPNRGFQVARARMLLANNTNSAAPSQPLNFTVNPAVPNRGFQVAIARAPIIPNPAQLCQFAKDGCDYDSMSPASILQHEQICHYRPINCCLKTDGCNYAQIPFFDYAEHLRGLHGAKYLQGSHHSHKYVVKPDHKKMIRDGSTSLFILEVSNQVFVVRGIQVEDWIYIWVAFHGHPNDGRVHRAEIEFNYQYDDNFASDQQPGTSAATYRQQFNDEYVSHDQNDDPVRFSGNVMATTRQNWEDIKGSRNYFCVKESHIEGYLRRELGHHLVESWAITITITRDQVGA